MAWARVNIAAFEVNLLVFVLCRLSLIGKNNRAVSSAHPTLVSPSGWAMHIWPVIFMSELIFVAWQSRGLGQGLSKAVSPWFAVACVLQAVWGIAFATELIIASAILLPAIAVVLTVAVVRLAPFKTGASFSMMSLAYWACHFPIGLHAGWTTAASLVNINMALESQGLRMRIAALLVTIVVAAVAAALVSLVFDDPAYLFAIAWATAAIAENDAFRAASLPEAVADGVSRALALLLRALIVIGVLVMFRPWTRGFTTRRGLRARDDGHLHPKTE